jgi:hypothetical protein
MTKQEGEWAGYSYLWNAEQTDATLVAAEGLDREYEIHVPKSAEHPDGLKKQVWHYPSRTECMVCHSRAQNFVLGVCEGQLNKEHDFGGVIEHQFDVLARLGAIKVRNEVDGKTVLREELKAAGKTDQEIKQWVAIASATRGQRVADKMTSFLPHPPEHYRKFADPYDAGQPLLERVKSYLHTNCASCHVEAGGGNSQMELGYYTALEKMKLIDARPVHHKYDLPDPRLVAAGHPERSILLYRLAKRGTGQMPQIGTALVDQRAVALFEEWIKQLPAVAPTAEAK